MKLAVVNDIHVGKCLEYNGRVRASSHLIEDMLPGFLREQENIVLLDTKEIRHDKKCPFQTGDAL